MWKAVNDRKAVISGAGVVTPIGVGMQDFTRSLAAGRSNFTRIRMEHLGQCHYYPAAVIDDFDYKTGIDKLAMGEDLKKRAKQLRNLSAGATHAIYASMEAWIDSGLSGSTEDPERIAVISGGSNTQQESLYRTHLRYSGKINFISPSYGLGFLDTDLVGALSELLNIRGEGHSVGAASASGNMAIIEGTRLIAGGECDIVLVVSPFMELSIYEYQALTALGAMATLRPDSQAEQLCNPFDESHCGFVYGQNSGALVLESENHAMKRGAGILGRISGYGLSMDGNRNPDPSAAGEAKAMNRALLMCGLSIEDIDVINTHGTASVIGDRTEIEAILSLGRKGIKVNATKALVGHGISSAGMIEAIACLAQINGDFLHPNPGLTTPISDEIGWITSTLTPAGLEYCMSNSFGFGGINTSIIFQKM